MRGTRAESRQIFFMRVCLLSFLGCRLSAISYRPENIHRSFLLVLCFADSRQPTALLLTQNAPFVLAAELSRFDSSPGEVLADNKAT